MRIRKSALDEVGRARHTLDVFDTLRFDRVPFDDTAGEYGRHPDSMSVYLGGVARVVHDSSQRMPRPNPGLYPDGQPLHVFLILGDHLGSSSVILDRDSAELVERTTYEAYGATESDFRPRRWTAFREDQKFTGKEEDVEVGATYFGTRYYQPYLGQ